MLTITYNTFKFPGEFKKYVIVTTAKPEEQDFVITLRGFVKEAPMGKIHIEPREIDLGRLGLETPQKQSYKISNVGTAPLTINKIYSIKSKTIYYDENKEGAIIIQPQETKVIELEIKPYKEGRFVEVIIFKSDARNSDENGYKIVVIGKVEGGN